MKKVYEQLTLRDEFVFGKVTEDERICKMILESLLNKEIEIAGEPVREKFIKMKKEGKAVRFDLYVKDSNSRIFDTEMQNEGSNVDKRYLPKRSRYYHSAIDSDELKKGKSYLELSETYVIFICTYDPFDKGKYCYTFKKKCREIECLELEDGTVTIFFNTEGDLSKAPKETAALLEYIKTGNVTNKVTLELDAAVTRIRENEEWRREYMLSCMWEEDARNEGIRIGEEKGEEKTLVSLVKDKLLSISEAAKRLGITEEEFSKKL
ncbi:MAG: Rpn family recombination-promoting nuclease/putative transposase [Lachnospiraceae bacterium]|nr:Rpn family recombination-promoting nuclease/putative transposase [Lachnospiraceae bacterium]